MKAEVLPIHVAATSVTEDKEAQSVGMSHPLGGTTTFTALVRDLNEQPTPDPSRLLQARRRKQAWSESSYTNPNDGQTPVLERSVAA